MKQSENVSRHCMEASSFSDFCLAIWDKLLDNLQFVGLSMTRFEYPVVHVAQNVWRFIGRPPKHDAINM